MRRLFEIPSGREVVERVGRQYVGHTQVSCNPMGNIVLENQLLAKILSIVGAPSSRGRAA